MLFESKLYTDHHIKCFIFLKLIHIQLAAGAVLLEALVPVHDLLVREGCLFSEQEVLADKD